MSEQHTDLTLRRALLLVAISIVFLWVATTTLNLLNMPNTFLVAFGIAALIAECVCAWLLIWTILKPVLAPKNEAKKKETE